MVLKQYYHNYVAIMNLLMCLAEHVCTVCVYTCVHVWLYSICNCLATQLFVSKLFSGE